MIYICIPTTEERRTRLAKCIESIHKFAGVPHCILTYENYREGFIAPIHKMLENLNGSTMVWCIGDDTILTEENTLGRLYEAYKLKFGDTKGGVVNPDDGIQHGRIITMPLCTAYTMRKYTYKGYFLNFADNEFTEIMEKQGTYLYVPEVKVDHQHHSAGKAPADETYAYANTRYPADHGLYEIRKAKGFLPLNDI